MSEIQTALRGRVKELLETGGVKYFIGWGETRFPGKTAPKFVFRPEEAESLVFNENCLNALAQYILDDRYPEGKIGLCVRGCDSRAVNRILADKQAQRENLYLIGIPCPGMVENGNPAEKCALCAHRNPVVFDEMIGQSVPEPQIADRFAEVAEMERLSPEEKRAYWGNVYDKCIRCYACRNVCPACNCVECYADQYRTGWQGKANNREENRIFGLTRAFHVSDRCVECGECQRVCPMGLPLMKLNRKLVKDTRDLFGTAESGLEAESKHALGTFLKEDVEEFM